MEIFYDTMDLQPAESKNEWEYYDCGPGKVRSGTEVNIDVMYVVFGEE